MSFGPRCGKTSASSVWKLLQMVTAPSAKSSHCYPFSGGYAKLRVSPIRRSGPKSEKAIAALERAGPIANAPSGVSNAWSPVWTTGNRHASGRTPSIYRAMRISVRTPFDRFGRKNRSMSRSR